MAALLDEADRVEADLGSLDEAECPEIDAMNALLGKFTLASCAAYVRPMRPCRPYIPLYPGEELSVAVHMQSHIGLSEACADHHAEPSGAFQQEAAPADPDDELPDMSGMTMHQKLALRAAHRRKLKLRAQKQKASEGAAAVQDV